MCIRSSISMKMNIQIFSVILYTQLSLLCGLTQGQVIELNQAGYRKIDITGPKVWKENVSFNGCVDNCKFRAACTAVNYHGIFHLCELDIEPYPEVVPTKRSGLHYWIKPKQEDSVECGTKSCITGYACNIQENKCEVKECSPLTIANTVILGNVNAVGAKVKMRCKEGFYAQGSTAITLTCKSNGDWSPSPLICMPGQVTELNQVGNGKIDITGPKVWIINVSFNGCVDECKFRAACTAVNFHGIFNLCELDIEPNPEVIPTKRRGQHYWIKPEQEDSAECGTQSCMSGYVCNIQEKKCGVKKCSHLSFANTVILGNVNAVGAKVKMRCKEGFYAQGSTAITLTCKSNGDWSPSPLICMPEPKDCADIKDMGQNEAKSRAYRIRPDGTSSFFVRCDMETLGGGWTVIQRRVSDSDFFKDWKTYQKGFGSLDTNFWLGLEQIHYISRQDRYELRVDMTKYDGTTEYACYNVFELGDLTSGYELIVDGYTGTAGDSLSYHNGQQFSTYDNDNDKYNENCAELYVGAWWYKACHCSNLNGDYGNEAFGKGLNWLTFTTYYKSLMSVEMKIRKVS